MTYDTVGDLLFILFILLICIYKVCIHFTYKEEQIKHYDDVEDDIDGDNSLFFCHTHNAFFFFSFSNFSIIANWN